MVEELHDRSYTRRKSRPMGSRVGRSNHTHEEGIDGTTQVPKDRKEWNVVDKLAIQNNAKAKKILICGIGLDEYNRISSCQDAKAIWETLQTAHEGTTQVKRSKIDNLNRQYELFRMTESETIQEMHTRFTAIINEIYSLDEIFAMGRQSENF